MDEFIYFSMQLIHGRPLAYYIELAQRQVIPSKRFIGLKTTLGIVLSVLDGLEYAHSQDVIHRDIKPANIMIEKHNKRPIIMDFGISKNLRDNNDKEQGPMGTPVNMAPEQLLGRNLDNRVDVYATGVMLFQMLVGNLPYAPHGSIKEILKLKLQDKWLTRTPCQMNPALNEDMDRIVHKAIAREPDDRYASCRDFGHDLQKYAAKYLKMKQ